MTRRQKIETIFIGAVVAVIISYVKTDGPWADFTPMSRISDIDKIIWLVGLTFMVSAGLIHLRKWLRAGEHAE